MPFDPGLAGAIASQGGDLLNSISQAQANRASRKFSIRMYDQQRRDNLAFWQMQNEYNSPQSQMRRFQQAGLNPNLIYGQGNSGNASPISTPDVQSPSFRSPEWGGKGGGLAAYYNTQIMQAQADNLKKQGTVLEQEAMLKAAQTRATMAGAGNSEFDLGFKNDLRDVNADFRREQLRGLTTSIDLSVNHDAREAARTSTNISEAVERMANLREQRLNLAISRSHTSADIERIRAEKRRIDVTVENLKKSGTLQDLEIRMRNNNMSYTDPLWSRLIGLVLTKAFDEQGNLRTKMPSLSDIFHPIFPQFKSRW